MWDDKMTNLVLHLCSHPSLAINGLGPLVAGELLPKSAYRGSFLAQLLPSVGTRVLVRSSPCKCNHAFSVLITSSSCTTAVISAAWGATAKLAGISFFLLHKFMDRRFVLTVDLSNFSIQFFRFLIKSRTFTFPQKESALRLPYGESKLLASRLLGFWATVK